MKKLRGHIVDSALLGGIAGAILLSVPAHAQDGVAADYDIAAQDLGAALSAIAGASHLQLVANGDLIVGKRCGAVHGHLSPQEALDEALDGTGLSGAISGDTIIIRGRSKPPSTQIAGTADQTPDIVVTGSRIRGAAPTSQVITKNREDIERAGQSNLGDFIRTIPQNFGGGQAPGIVNVQGSSENVSSGSSLNLRGLGPDATLTLVNGHRVAYDAAFQGVDISAIPLAALDRIEIVPDGASALYGSDAVGGVANVILRRDFDGLEASARLGTATDGGDEQQEYSAVVGRKWGSGGVMGVVDYSRSTAITARDRSVTRTLDDSETLYPAIRQISAVISGHQQLADHVGFELDAQYSDRHSTIRTPFTATADYLTEGSLSFPSVRSYSVTPSVRLDLPGRWQLTAAATFADSRTGIPSSQFVDGLPILSIAGSYKDQTKNVEATAEGPLLALAGGDIRLAIGGGYRSTSLDTLARITVGGATSTLIDFGSSRRIVFGYGELSIPLIGKSNAKRWADQLVLTGAVRYEDYRGIAQVASPKFGLIYKPHQDFTIKASWGKSFKAPTLYQEGQLFEATLLQASSFGYPGARAEQTGLELLGGNPNLKPERATTWTTTLSYEPSFLRGLKVEASYFHISYRNRIITPLSSIDGVYSNPAFQNVIAHDPTADRIAGIIARAPLGLENYSGQTFDPANVVLIVDNSLQNSARQVISGVDLDADYRFTLGADERLDLSGSATYLTSSERLTPDSPAFALAGTIFNPPHWRARVGTNWDKGRVGLGAFANYSGGTRDHRFAPFVGVRSFTTLDAVAHVATAANKGIWKGIQITFSALNVLNQKPGFIRTTSPNSAPYDATNVSVVGRLVSLTISKRW